jgi:probable F420-dependent oxidoreductase
VRFGAIIGGPLTGIPEAARAVEDLGYESIWTAETGSSAFVAATLAAQATSKAKIGTAIAVAFPRSPAITAMTAVDIDELSGGRFILGLGTQVKRVNEQRFSTPFEHPAPKMREYAHAVRAFIGGYFGEEPSFEGRFYNVTMAPWPRVPPPVRRDIPIYFAAVNKHMLRASGAVADGVVGHPMTSVRYITESVRPEIARGAQEAGRDPSEIRLSQQALISVADDRDKAKREVKQQIGFYATTRTYIPVLAAHGFEDIVGDLREAYAQKDMDKLASLVSDEMADTFGIYGTVDEVKEKMKRFDGIVDEVILGGPWYRVEMVRLIENYQLMLQAFAPSDGSAG